MRGLSPYSPLVNTFNPFFVKKYLKYIAVIMLKEILKHTSKYLNDDVKEWIFKKALQGSKND
jgi:hypothetical protein